MLRLKTCECELNLLDGPSRSRALRKLLIFIAPMASALNDIVYLEMIIERKRNELFQRIISHVPSTPSGNEPYNSESIPGPGDNLSIDQTRPTENVPSAQSLDDNKKQDDMQDILGYFYFVQDSFLSDDGSERIFKVKHKSFEYHYCAFEFKD